MADFKAMGESKQTQHSLPESWKEFYDLSGCSPSYGKHKLDVYEVLGLVEQYQGRDNTFHHHFLGTCDREKIAKAEERIRIYISDFGMTVAEAIAKLKTLKKL